MAIQRPQRPLQRPSDSLARCDPHAYSNFYDANKKVDLRVQAAGPTQPIHKDTLQISKEKLTEDAMNRLRHTSKYMVFQTGFMRIGKYLFLAAVFPPYFILFGIPKWIIVQGLPAMMTICTVAAEKVKKKIKKRADAVKQKIAQVVLAIQQTLQRKLTPIIRLGLEIYHAFHRMRQSAATFTAHLKNRAKAFIRVDLKIKQLARNAKEKVKGLFTRIQERKTEIQEKIVLQLQPALHLMRTCQQWMAQLPQWGSLQMGKITGAVRLLKGKWKGKFDVSQKAAEKSMEWLTKHKEQVVWLLNAAMHPLRKYYQGRLKPALAIAYAYFQKKQKKGRDAFNQKREQLLQFLHAGQEKMKKANFQHASDWVIKVSQFSRFPFFVQWTLRKLIGNRVVLFLFRNGFKLFSNGVRYYLLGLSYIIVNFSKVNHFISKGWKWLTGSVGTFFQQSIKILTIGLHAFEWGLKKGLYWVLLFCIMLGIVFAWGMQFLGELTQKGLKAFSFKTAK